MLRVLVYSIIGIAQIREVSLLVPQLALRWVAIWNYSNLVGRCLQLGDLPYMGWEIQFNTDQQWAVAFALA